MVIIHSTFDSKNVGDISTNDNSASDGRIKSQLKQTDLVSSGLINIHFARSVTILFRELVRRGERVGQRCLLRDFRQRVNVAGTCTLNIEVPLTCC